MNYRSVVKCLKKLRPVISGRAGDRWFLMAAYIAGLPYVLIADLEFRGFMCSVGKGKSHLSH